jgi:uncharacterized protein (TIGR00156 family)
MWTLALVASIFVGVSANAANKTITKPVTHAADVPNMQDDTIVYLQGTLTKSLGDEMYVFSDASGNIYVEIDSALMQGQTFVPDMAVIITATVDKEGNITSLEAQEIDFINANQMSNAQ